MGIVFRDQYNHCTDNHLTSTGDYHIISIVGSRTSIMVDNNQDVNSISSLDLDQHIHHVSYYLSPVTYLNYIICPK